MRNKGAPSLPPPKDKRKGKQPRTQRNQRDQSRGPAQAARRRHRGLALARWGVLAGEGPRHLNIPKRTQENERTKQEEKEESKRTQRREEGQPNPRCAATFTACASSATAPGATASTRAAPRSRCRRLRPRARSAGAARLPPQTERSGKEQNKQPALKRRKSQKEETDPKKAQGTQETPQAGPAQRGARRRRRGPRRRRPTRRTTRRHN